MENRTSIPGDKEEHASLLFGMQRSGSNYAMQVLHLNFPHIRFLNQTNSRCLPTHKHFRHYEEKSAIPNGRYYNSFRYPSFQDFREHAMQVAGMEINFFIICIKDPCSWYLSYLKHARKNKIPYYRRTFNTHFLIDYNLFYRKWLDFSLEAPRQVFMLRYEDLIDDLEGSLEILAAKLELERLPRAVNPSKVPMNRKFTKAKVQFYRERKYLDLISEEDKFVMKQLLDQELISTFNYQISP